MKRRTLEKQGLVIGAFLFTILGMKIRDIQMDFAIRKAMTEESTQET